MAVRRERNQPSLVSSETDRGSLQSRPHRQRLWSAKNWLWTIWLPEDVTTEAEASGHGSRPVFKPESMTLLVFQLERGFTSGRLHWQGVCQLRSKTSLRQLKMLFDSSDMHAEPARCLRKAIEYVTKESTREAGPWRYEGEAPITQMGKPSARRLCVQEILRAPKTAKKTTMVEFPEVWAVSGRGLDGLIRGLVRPYVGLREVGVFIGATGTGKTRLVYDTWDMDDVYPVASMEKNATWFDGYNYEKVVLFDEMGPDALSINKMKKLLDRYKEQVPVKGAFMAWCAEVVILTSNYPMTEWWPKASAADFNALARRVKVFDFDDPVQRREAAGWCTAVRRRGESGEGDTGTVRRGGTGVRDAEDAPRSPPQVHRVASDYGSDEELVGDPGGISQASYLVDLTGE